MTIAATPVPLSEAKARLSELFRRVRRHPRRVGKPRTGPPGGCHGARRGTYRIVYLIDENTRTVHVLDVDHRSEIYGPRP
jgi:mRNA interferase RelE/StbE